MIIRQNVNLVSLAYIIVGLIFIFFSLDIVFKLLLLVIGLWLFWYGFSLRGFNIRSIVHRFLMGMLR